MARLLLALLVGLVGAAVVHIAVIFTVPLVAENNAWGRLSRLGALFAPVRIDTARIPAETGSPGAASQVSPAASPGFAFVDPAFATVACRFSLADGPARLAASRATDFWSASIYSREGDNLYSINDRSAVGGQFDLLVGTSEQLAEARASSAERDETAIPVEVAITEGYLTLRVLVDEESKRPGVEAFMASVTCEAAAMPDANAATSLGG